MQNAQFLLIMALAMPALAQQSNVRFSHTLETTAPPEAIWR